MTDLIPTPSVDTWWEGQLITKDLLNANSRDVQQFIAYAPVTIVTRVATQSIPNGTNTAVSFDTEIIDIDAMFSAPSTDLVVQRAGVYSIQFESGFETNANGSLRAAHITINANGNWTSSANSSQGEGNNCMGTSAIVALGVGDKINGYVYQDSGGALNVGNIYNAPRMSVRLVSTVEIPIDYSDPELPEEGEPEPPPSPPPTPPKPTQHTATFSPTWSRSYDGDLGTTWDDSPYCYQGYYSSARGNTRSLVGFDYAAIKRTLTGATGIAGQVWFTPAHTYRSDGLPVFPVYHNYQSKPSTWASSRVWHMGTTPAVRENQCYHSNLSAACVSGFKSGAVTGIGFGPPSSTDHRYYGYMYGKTQSGKPTLHFTYWK